MPLIHAAALAEDGESPQSLSCGPRTLNNDPAIAVLREQALVEHALRHTLVADSLALQIKLPPEGVPAPIARSSPAVAGGTPVVETLASTSLWAVAVLKALAQARFLTLFGYLSPVLVRSESDVVQCRGGRSPAMSIPCIMPPRCADAPAGLGLPGAGAAGRRSRGWRLGCRFHRAGMQGGFTRSLFLPASRPLLP